MSGLPAGELVDLVGRLTASAEKSGTTLRALGGLGIHLRAPDAPATLTRMYGDVDVVAPGRHRREVEAAMTAAGLRGDEYFNKMQGSHRQIWWRADGATHVDVFLGEFRMCHRLDLEDRLPLDHAAIPAADLLLTKLQIVELNQKDVADVAALFLTHRISDHDSDGVINLARLRAVLVGDWGFYTTATDNLKRLGTLVASIDTGAAAHVAAAAEAITSDLASAPKTRAFNLRAAVGRRKRWYELPEESM